MTICESVDLGGKPKEEALKALAQWLAFSGVALATHCFTRLAGAQQTAFTVHVWKEPWLTSVDNVAVHNVPTLLTQQWTRGANRFLQDSVLEMATALSADGMFAVRPAHRFTDCPDLSSAPAARPFPICNATEGNFGEASFWPYRTFGKARGFQRWSWSCRAHGCAAMARPSS